MDAIVPAGNTSLVIDRKDDCDKPRRSYDDCGYSRRDCATRDDVEGLETRLNVGENSQEIRQQAAKLALHVADKVNDEGREGRLGLLRVADKLGDSVEKFGLAGLVATKDLHKDVEHEFGKLKFLIAKEVGESKLESAKQYASVLLEAAKAKAEIELEALKNTTKIKDKIAECCAETHMLIKETACETKELVRSVEEKRLRERLEEAQDEARALRFRFCVCAKDHTAP